MNRTEINASRTGHNKRYGNHVCGLPKLDITKIAPQPEVSGDIVDPKIVKQLEDLNRETNDLLPVEVWLKHS